MSKLLDVGIGDDDDEEDDEDYDGDDGDNGGDEEDEDDDLIVSRLSESGSNVDSQRSTDGSFKYPLSWQSSSKSSPVPLKSLQSWVVRSNMNQVQ